MVLEHRAERRLRRSRRRAPARRARSAPAPSRSSRRAPAASAGRAARSSATNAAASAASRSGTPGTRSFTISISRSSDGWPIQWKRQRRLSASCSSRVRFEVRITYGRCFAVDRAELGHRDLEVREHLEQKRLELLVGAVDLVDQEHDRLARLDRLEQRPADQELGAEELRLVDRSLLGGADVQQLPRVVPLVDRVRDVQALVALEPDQPRAERLRDRLRSLRLADARLAFEQQRLLELQREVERGREPAVGEVRRPRRAPTRARRSRQTAPPERSVATRLTRAQDR